MFDQTFVNEQARTHRPWTVAASVMLQTALVAAILIVPLLRVPKLTLPAKIQIAFPVEKVDITAKPEPVRQSAARSVLSAHTVFQLPVIHVPTTVPRFVDTTPDPPQIAIATPAGTAAGSSALSGLAGLPAAPPAVHESAPGHSQTPAQIHVGGAVQEGKLIVAPRPAYPRIAVATRTQGTVRIQAIIERDGTIGHLKVLSGPPLLVNAALEAVQQWRYKPTLLNGEPVEVVTEIEVKFTLNQN